MDESNIDNLLDGLESIDTDVLDIKISELQNQAVELQQQIMKLQRLRLMARGVQGKEATPTQRELELRKGPHPLATPGKVGRRSTFLVSCLRALACGPLKMTEIVKITGCQHHQMVPELMKKHPQYFVKMEGNRLAPWMLTPEGTSKLNEFEEKFLEYAETGLSVNERIIDEGR